MIDVYASTPQIYYDNSRDFQTLGRVFEVLLNYVKTGVDLVDNSPFAKNLDAKLLHLLAKTLGFDAYRGYTERELRSVCSSFVEMMRCKGSVRSVDIAVSAFLSSQRISGAYRVKGAFDEEFGSQVIIDLPISVTDTTMLEDLLDYILPAGTSPKIEFSAYGGVVSHSTEFVSLVKTYTYGPQTLGLVAIEDENDEKPTYANAMQGLALTFTGVINTPIVSYQQFGVRRDDSEPASYDDLITNDNQNYYVLI